MPRLDRFRLRLYCCGQQDIQVIRLAKDALIGPKNGTGQESALDGVISRYGSRGGLLQESGTSMTFVSNVPESGIANLSKA
jgi:hypothetical protein